jgi:hypothetical protein
VAFPSTKSVPTNPSIRLEVIYPRWPTKRLITPRRLDLAVKWRFFRHLLGGDDGDAVDLYRWHIEQRSGHRIALGIPTDQWKRSIDEYVDSATALLQSLSTYGFLGPVPVDVDGELLDGSHRVACAAALGIDAIPVDMQDRRVWAPAWDDKWFKARMTDEGVNRLITDWQWLAL